MKKNKLENVVKIIMLAVAIAATIVITALAYGLALKDWVQMGKNRIKKDIKSRVNKTLTEWTAPEANGPEILSMPNIYHALQGKGMQPRTILKASEWDKLRKECYEKAGYKCEICGYEHQFPADLHAHEVFTTNWKEGYAKFERLICLCRKCHLSGIHSGRALTEYTRRSPVWTKEKLLDGVEHTFKLAQQHNLRLFTTFVGYMDEPELAEEMKALIEKYDIKFYKPCKPAEWKEWRMIFNGKEYKTPYADMEDYEQQMREQHQGQQKEDYAKHAEKMQDATDIINDILGVNNE